MGGSNRPWSPPPPMVQPQYPDTIPTGGYPPGMTPWNGTPYGDIENGGPLLPPPTGGSQYGSFDPSQTFNFDSQMWEGLYGAPLTTMQLDSMGAMQRMLQADPLAQTQDINQAISQSLGGMQPTFGPSFGAQELGSFQDMFQDVFSGARPQLNPGTNIGSYLDSFDSIMQGMNQQLGPGTNINPLLSQAQGLYGSIPQAGAEGANLIRGATGLSEGSQAIFDQTIPAFGELLSGPSFDTTDMFASGEQAFQTDLDRAMAQAREEYSGLGLDPGSTDRAEGLARTGATESARFRNQQQQTAMQAFENAQQRRLAAAGLAPGLSAAFENPQDRALQAGSILSQLGLQGAGMQGDMLSQLTQMSQIPFGENLARAGVNLQAGGQQASMLPNLLQALQIPFDQQMQSAGLGLQGSSLQAQMLPQLLQAANTSFGQNMDLAGLGLQQQQVGAGILPSLLQAFNNPAMLAGQGFNMGTTAQQTADQQIQRMMGEFGRTQNAMLPAMMSLISGSPMQQASYGPSTLSQLGSLAGGGLNLAAQLGWSPFD